jgi:hypothetical protein
MVLKMIGLGLAVPEGDPFTAGKPEQILLRTATAQSRKAISAPAPGADWENHRKNSSAPASHQSGKRSAHSRDARIMAGGTVNGFLPNEPQGWPIEIPPRSFVLARDLGDDQARCAELMVRSDHGSGKGLERQNKRPWIRTPPRRIGACVAWFR